MIFQFGVPSKLFRDFSIFECYFNSKNHGFIFKMANADNTIFVKHKIFSWKCFLSIFFHFFIFWNQERGWINVFFKYWQSKIITKYTKNTQESEYVTMCISYFLLALRQVNSISNRCGMRRGQTFVFQTLPLWSCDPTLFQQLSQPGDQDSPGWINH